MKAMEFIASIRRKGAKPAFVMLDLVDGHPMAPWCTETGAVHAEIGSVESLTEIDFRPLVGLDVHLGDRSGNDRRLRRVSKLSAEAKPHLLAVFTERDGAMTMHRLWADGRTDRSVL